MNPRNLTILALLALASPAAGHEFWLAPSRYATTPGAAITVRALAGTGFRGEAKPWDPLHAVRFTARTSRTIDLGRAASPGDFTWIRFAPRDGGGAMLAFESSFTPIELPAGPFEKYLADEGLDGPLAARRRPHATAGRERFRRCAKTWLAGTAAERATAAAGLPLEILPLSIPGSEPVFRARLTWNGSPLAGALVKAWRASPGQNPASRDSIPATWKGRTDGRGEISIPIRDPGEWLIGAVHMIPCLDRAEADWESTWASLTFQR